MRFDGWAITEPCSIIARASTTALSRQRQDNSLTKRHSNAPVLEYPAVLDMNYLQRKHSKQQLKIQTRHTVAVPSL